VLIDEPKAAGVGNVPTKCIVPETPPVRQNPKSNDQAEHRLHTDSLLGTHMWSRINIEMTIEMNTKMTNSAQRGESNLWR
jgi:hypothetical protein